MRLAIIFICALALMSCSSDDAPPEDHVFRTQTDALKKAEDVEKKALQHASDMKQRLDSIENGVQQAE